jgi:transcription elongation factor GreA
MNHNVYHSLRESLVGQLVYLEENGASLVDSYFASDMNRYTRFFNQYTSCVQSFLSKMNDKSELSPSISQVFIGSQVSILYEEEQDMEQFTICFPDQVDPDKGYISFLSPVGSQLLLRFLGEKIVLVTPGGNTEVNIKEIIFKSH